MSIDASHPEFQAALALFDARMEDLRKTQNIPGMSVGLLAGRDFTWTRGYGHADLNKQVPAGPDTVYRIGSITKLFTATMLMMLRDAGKLQLDEPVEKYLPAFKVRTSFPGAKPPTFREMAAHLAGMPREFPGDYWREQRFPSIAEMLRRIEEIEMVIPQMTEIKYSNLAFAVLGHALETIAGQPYKEFIHQHILDPLGMPRTGFHETEPNIQPWMSAGYKVEKGCDPVLETYPDIGGFTPAGQMASSVADILKFAAFHLSEQEETPGVPQLLSPRTLREMHAPVYMAPDWQTGRAIGFGLGRVANHTTIAHTGGINGFVTDLRIVPDLKLAVAVFTNCNSDPISISRAGLELLIPVVERNLARGAAAEQPPSPDWDRFIGKYEDSDVRLVAGKLVIHTPDAAPSPADVVLTPVGENRFKMKGGSVSGEVLKFDIDPEDGHVRGMWVGSYYVGRKD